MRGIIILIFVAILGFAPTAQAQNSPVVVELYTSQGCSSCPPADAFLTELSTRKDVIALALHVDYWDYLGWPDQFASAVFTNRQRAYAMAASKKTVYTPQIVVQGVAHAVGNRINDVNRLIAQFEGQTAPVAITLSRSGGALTISVRALLEDVGPSFVQIVRYHPRAEVKILAGENAGREIVYSNIVTYWKPIARWNGTGELNVRANIQGGDPVVVLVQREGPGAILAAEVLR